MHSYGGSYIGRRRNNEDCIGKREPAHVAVRAARGCLYIVSDGMGGHAAGEVASRTVVETVLTEYYAGSDAPAADLLAAIQKAGARVREVSCDLNCEGMGATVVACLVAGKQVILAHVGDSRAYRLRQGRLQLLTRDHLYLSEELGLPESEIPGHHLRHVLSRALGLEGGAAVDALEFDWEAGDRFLLCSDGLSNSVPEAALALALDQDAPRDAVAALLHLAEENRAEDNSSAVVIHLES